MRSHRDSHRVLGLSVLILLLESSHAHAQSQIEAPSASNNVRSLVFDGARCERRFPIKELGASMPTDWSEFSHLVLEMRTSSPQRFGLWVYTSQGARRIEIQPFGQNAWLRASIPLRYLKGMDQSGSDLASTINRRTNSFWMSVWGPFGELKNVEAIGLAMEYPIHKPTIELRNIHLSKQDEGSEFLESKPVRDEFDQWALADWPGKIKSREQLAQELADEEQRFGSGADFGYDQFGGYKATQAKATGFFRVEQVEGKWWFVDPEGHLYLSLGVNGAGAGFGGGRGAQATGRDGGAAANLMTRRLESWGMTTGGTGRANTAFLRWPQNRQTTFLGLPDVYSEEFAADIDSSARTQCESRKGDPLLLGYFIGNEPPWGGRESEVVDMILAGADSATKAKLKEFVSPGDSPKRRQEFVVTAFEKYLKVICAAVRKYDPNHLILGIRFGGRPSDDVLRLGRVFDVCSINVYEYEPTKQVERAYRLTGRPVLIGEFHVGVPEDGLGAGLVQARDQVERGIGYRYYVEQAAALDSFLGAHWFQWRDEPVLGRMDGENYNIGFVDATDRPYPELVKAAIVTHKRLLDVHSGRILPFAQKPMASDAGAPSSPWD
jgi:hypothetical protein